jgi:hypothetical protein
MGCNGNEHQIITGKKTLFHTDAIARDQTNTLLLDVHYFLLQVSLLVKQQNHGATRRKGPSHAQQVGQNA